MDGAEHAVGYCMGRWLLRVKGVWVYAKASAAHLQAALESDMRITKEDALALASTSLEKLLGGESSPESSELVATEGGDLLQFGSKVIAVISPLRGVTDLF